MNHNYKKIIYIFIILVCSNSGLCRTGSLHIVTDAAYWYPFTYGEKDQAKGMHVDMVREALTALGYEVSFEPKPWKRCLLEAQRGKCDAVVSASHSPRRAKFLYYPDDADTGKSLLRITQVEYVVVTSSDSRYVYDGDPAGLPQPVRAPLGYSIVKDLQDSGIRVFEAPDTLDCVYQLVKSKRGSFITPYQNAVGIKQMSRFGDQVRISKKPVKSKSYFIVFPKKNQSLNAAQRKAIWVKISNLRENQSYMKALWDGYSKF